MTTPNFHSGDEIMEAFNLIDHDSGGEITLEELTKALQSADVGISSEEVNVIFKNVGVHQINKLSKLTLFFS